MATSLVQYSVVDAFTTSAFKGNPAVVCFLEEEKSDDWLQAVATEFNLSQTGYIIRFPGSVGGHSPPSFRLRWFTPVAEVKLCGHATLAAAHSLFSSGSVDSDRIEFETLSGILTAKRVPDTGAGETARFFTIELDFPMIGVRDYNGEQLSLISKAVNGTPIVELQMTAFDDILVLFSSAEEVESFQPQFDVIEKCPGRGLIITAVAPHGSGFDFYSRFFCPKMGIYEDPVCGSAHCVLAPYWSKKLGKDEFVANAVSPRGGVVNLQLHQKNGRVLLRGKAVTVMKGSLLV